jgi:hypothetical protein
LAVWKIKASQGLRPLGGLREERRHPGKPILCHNQLIVLEFWWRARWSVIVAGAEVAGLILLVEILDVLPLLHQPLDLILQSNNDPNSLLHRLIPLLQLGQQLFIDLL